jgi:LysM domain
MGVIEMVSAGQARMAGQYGTARPVRRVAVPAAPVGGGRWHGVLAGLVVVVLASVAVFGLGQLFEAARVARVPAATARVRVDVGESLWHVARRVAPSADPGAVAARIAELNGLVSPSVQPGEVLISPIG